MEIDFTHHQSAHCENGVVANLRKHNGCDVSEPMGFGIGSGFRRIPLVVQLLTDLGLGLHEVLNSRIVDVL